MSILKILIVVTNIHIYESGKLETGLWLSELTHLYHEAMSNGYEVTIASPNGGHVPIDPESLKRFTLDNISRQYWSKPSFRELLKNSNSLMEVSGQQFDCVYLAGGHGTMYDFPNDTTLQHIIKEHYETGKIVSAVCHGVGGLLNVRLSNGAYLIKGKTIAGFNWFERHFFFSFGQTKKRSAVQP